MLNRAVIFFVYTQWGTWLRDSQIQIIHRCNVFNEPPYDPIHAVYLNLKLLKLIEKNECGT